MKTSAAGDTEYNPAMEPEKAKAWLNLLQESEKAFEEWNDACDNIEKLYANLEHLAQHDARPAVQFVLGQPRNPEAEHLRQKLRCRWWCRSSRTAGRCTRSPASCWSAAPIVAFDLTRINDLLMLVRDDLATTGRGVAWCRYEPADEERDKPEYVCVDHKGRRDFLHSLSRNWREVTWVAAASYLTRAQAKARFGKYSGDEYQKAEYKVDKDLQEIGGGDNRERAKFWEIWHKGMNTVVWVAEGCEDVLDEAEPDELAQLHELLPVPEAGLHARRSRGR